MVFTLKVLNEDATLNNWVDIGSAQIVRKSDAKLLLQLIQVERKIRYVPIALAAITTKLLNSDGTTVDKTASFPFPDDRSIIEFDLSDTDTTSLIGQNLIVQVVEGSNTYFAILQLGLQVLNTENDC